MTNTSDFSKLSPSKVLRSSFLKTYKETRDIIARELLRLRSNLFVLDKLLRFPNELFLGLDKQDFFALVRIGLTESSLLIITKLTTDTGRDVLSMLRFKNLVRKQVKRKYIKAFDHILKENKFSKTVDTSKQKVKSIRDNLIAHLIIDENLQPKIPDYVIPFEEIDLIANELKRLFDALCFSHMYMTLPIGYEPSVKHPAGSDSRSDIEYLLDLIVQDSYLFKMPEESLYWNITKETLPKDTIKILNEYRRKFGKPEV